MKCDRCGERTGEIRYTEYTHGVAEKQLICARCAEDLGFGPSDADTGASDEGGAEGSGSTAEPTLFEAALLVAALPGDTRCPGCGLRAVELQNVSLLGCPQCYDVYGELLGATLERLHGAAQHRGRLPRRAEGETE